MQKSNRANGIRSIEDARRDFGRMADADLFVAAFGSRAQAVRNNFPGPRQLAAATPAELSASGVSERTGRVVAATFELARRAHRPPSPDRVTSPEEAFAHLAPLLSDSSVETVAAIAIGAGGHVIETFRLSEGGLDAARLDSRVLLGRLLRLGAVSFVLGHNHPSGDTSPSRADFATTGRLNDAATFLDLVFLDHLVVAGDRWESLRSMGALSGTKQMFDELPDRKEMVG